MVWQGHADVGADEGVRQFEVTELRVAEERAPVVGEVARFCFVGRECFSQFGQVGEVERAVVVRGGAPGDEWLRTDVGSANVDVAVELADLRGLQAVAHGGALREEQEGAVEGFVGGEEVIHERVVVAFFDVGAGARMPAEVVADGAAFAALDLHDAVEKRVLVNLYIGGIEDVDAAVAVYEDVAGADRVEGDFVEETVVGSFDPIIDEDAVDFADVVPDAAGVRVVDDEVIAACGAVGLVKYFHGRREVAQDAFGAVGARDDVFLEENVGGGDDVDAFGAAVGNEAVADHEIVAAKITGHARAEGKGDVFERRADDFLAELRRGHALLGLGGFDFERAVGVLGEGDAADCRAAPVGGFAMCHADGSGERAVLRGDFDDAVFWICGDEDELVLVVDVVGFRCKIVFACDGTE